MDKVLTAIKIVFAAIGGWLAQILGGWDGMLIALVVLACADILTGLIKAALRKSDKSSSGGVSSGAMWRGGLKKLLMFVLVAVAVVADDLISPASTLIRGIVISYYIATEALSVIENALQCGIPVPGKLKSIFEAMKSKNDNADTAETEERKE